MVGDISVTPFTIPHDAADPVGFTFRADGVKMGIATDLGYMPPNVCDHLRGCDVLVIESNHDLEMLRGGAISLVGQAAGQESDVDTCPMTHSRNSYAPNMMEMHHT